LPHHYDGVYTFAEKVVFVMISGSICKDMRSVWTLEAMMD